MAEIIQANFRPNHKADDRGTQSDSTTPNNIVSLNIFQNRNLEIPEGYTLTALIPGLEVISYEDSFYEFLDQNGIFILQKFNGQYEKTEYFLYKKNSRPSLFQFQVNVTSAFEYQICEWINVVSQNILEIKELSSLSQVKFISTRGKLPFYSLINHIKNISTVVKDHRSSFESDFTYKTITRYIDSKLEYAGRLQQNAIDSGGEG